MYEISHAALNPARAWADATRLFFKNPINPMSFTTFGKSIAAASELFERSTRRYGRPEWRINSTMVSGTRVPVHINTIWERPFCKLIHFERAGLPALRPQPTVLSRGTDVGSPCDAAARHRAAHCCPIRTSTSPTGSMRAWCRCRKARSAWTITSITSTPSSTPGRGRARHLRVSAYRAGAGRHRADGSRQRSVCADLHGADGRTDRHAREADPGQYAREDGAWNRPSTGSWVS